MFDILALAAVLQLALVVCACIQIVRGLDNLGWLPNLHQYLQFLWPACMTTEVARASDSVVACANRIWTTLWVTLQVLSIAGALLFKLCARRCLPVCASWVWCTRKPRPLRAGGTRRLVLLRTRPLPPSEQPAATVSQTEQTSAACTDKPCNALDALQERAACATAQPVAVEAVEVCAALASPAMAPVALES